MPKHTKAYQATAYHEAGHAVACWYQNIGVGRVTIQPSDGNLGHTLHSNILRGLNIDYDDSDRNRIKVERLVRVCLAGDISARIFWTRRPKLGAGSDDDIERAINALEHFVGSTEELEAWLKLLEIQTRQLLRIRWWAVEAIAQALLEQQTITRKAFRALMNDALTAAIRARAIPQV